MRLHSLESKDFRFAFKFHKPERKISLAAFEIESTLRPQSNVDAKDEVYVEAIS